MKLDKQEIIEWIYSLQVERVDDDCHQAGFLGGSFLGESSTDFRQGHLAMTYTALATLRSLGDDLSRVDRAGIVRSLSTHQLENGSFRCVRGDSEFDMRFLYCACCISHMLGEWSGVDVDAACSYVLQSKSWDGGFALLPNGEGHGGSTFCAIASLVLMGRLETTLDDLSRQRLISWCTRRQVGGMQGRPNKAEDTCYSYWITGTLRLLGHDDVLDHEALVNFVMKCQSRIGGFSKLVRAHPDPLHAYYSLAYLSLSKTHTDSCALGLAELGTTLGIGIVSSQTFGDTT